MLSLTFIAVLFGCDSATTRYTGTYVSVSERESSQIETVLELKEPATGVWTANEKEVQIRWSVKGMKFFSTPKRAELSLVRFQMTQLP
jgi:hypothetical protein